PLPHGSGVLGVAFSPDGAALATAGRDGTVRVWGLTPAAPLTELPYSPGVSKAAFTPDSKTLLLWERGGGAPLLRFDATDGHALTPPLPTGGVGGKDFPPEVRGL